MGVFGNPVTDETLEGLPRYDGKKIGPIDRARVALNWKNAEGKDVRALQYAENLMEKCGVDVATLCLIYNATGGTVEYSGHKDWEGHLGAAPYPIMIENGQWGVFLHQQNPGSDAGCVGAIVYCGTNAENDDCDWMLAWRLRKDTNDNRAYTDVREINHFNGRWDEVRNSLLRSDSLDKSDSHGCLSFVSIGNNKYSICRAILTLRNANKNTR